MSETASHYQPINGIDFKVTDTCMLHCDFCVNADGDHKKNDVDVPKAIDALHELQDAPDDLGRLEKVFFTGGETLMKIDLVEQVARAIPEDTFTGVATNGIMLTRKRLDRLKAIKLSRIKLSYDTTQAKDFVTIRRGGTPRHFESIEKNMEDAAVSGILLYLRIALGRLNVGVMEDIYRKAMDLGVDTLQIKPIIASGRARENKNTISLTPQKLLAAFEALGEIYDETRTRVSISCFPPAARFGLPVKPCANNQKFYWEVNGDMYTCNYSMDPTNYLGNYHEQGGVLKALEERRRRYGDLFNEHRVIANCPAINNYREL